MLQRAARRALCQAGCRCPVYGGLRPSVWRGQCMAGPVYGSGRAASSTAAARAPAAAAGHDTALLLIDFQRGFITGTWAEEQGLSPFLPRPPPARPLARFPLTLSFSLSGGAEEVLPIADAAARLADLYATTSLPSLATRFFLQSLPVIDFSRIRHARGMARVGLVSREPRRDCPCVRVCTVGAGRCALDVIATSDLTSQTALYERLSQGLTM